MRLVYDYDCEGPLGQELLQAAKRGQLPSREQLQARFLPSKAHRHTQAPTVQHCLSSYDQLLMPSGEASMPVEVCHG